MKVIIYNFTVTKQRKIKFRTLGLRERSPRPLYRGVCLVKVTFTTLFTL